MKSWSRTGFSVLSLIVLFAGMFLFVRPQCMGAEPMSNSVWEGDVFSSGVPVVSSVLEAGKSFVIQVAEIWFYDYDANLAADAMYYTASPSDSWDWPSYSALAGNHSFLQIDGNDVNWGPFSNGGSGHKYAIAYNGTGAALSFRIVDWVDSNYANNVCHIHVSIYSSTTVGGYILDYGVSDGFVGLLVFVAASGVVVVGPVVVFLGRRKK